MTIQIRQNRETVSNQANSKTCIINIITEVQKLELWHAFVD